MSSRILISDLIVHAVIGVYAFEQSITQPLSITLSFAIDTARAAKTDALEDTVDYAAICASIVAFVENHPCRLIETLAERLSEYLQTTLQLRELQLSITKKPQDLPNVSGVAVVLNSGSH